MGPRDQEQTLEINNTRPHITAPKCYIAYGAHTKKNREFINTRHAPNARAKNPENKRKQTGGPTRLDHLTKTLDVTKRAREPLLGSTRRQPLKPGQKAGPNRAPKFLTETKDQGQEPGQGAGPTRRQTS